MRPETDKLCEAVWRAHEACFDPWCTHHERRAQPDQAAVIASQAPLHEAVLALRAWCAADPAAAEAERLELLRLQVEGQAAFEASRKQRRSAAVSGQRRQEWNNARWRLVSYREALTIGLGWPHRGELVTLTEVDYFYPNVARGTDRYTGPGLYERSGDVFEVGHCAWIPNLRSGRATATATPHWSPPKHDEQLRRADPAGDIPMRIAGAEDKPLPVPLPRWPGPDDIEGGIDPMAAFPEGSQLELFG